MSKRHDGTKRSALALLAATLLIAGCASPPPAPAPAASAPAPAPAPVVPAPAPAPAPELTPAQAKAQAQKLAIEAVDQLQNGEEAAARATLDKALELDAGNELARKLADQVKADADKELGPVFFRYTVQRDDSLSKIAQQYLGDRFRFYILAKYNGITNPNRLSAGQVIKVPGRTPPPGATPATAGARPHAEPEAKPATEAAPAQPDASALIAKGVQMQRAGDLEGAYNAFSEAAQTDPGNRDAMMQRDAARQAMVRKYDREAAQAFQRQNLDLAIAKWDRILELDPANQKAKLERERALELKKKLAEKFGAK
jgi:tetratricopeptide (TPR) repeat protein